MLLRYPCYLSNVQLLCLTGQFCCVQFEEEINRCSDTFIAVIGCFKRTALYRIIQRRYLRAFHPLSEGIQPTIVVSRIILDQYIGIGIVIEQAFYLEYLSVLFQSCIIFGDTFSHLVILSLKLVRIFHQPVILIDVRHRINDALPASLS